MASASASRRKDGVTGSVGERLRILFVGPSVGENREEGRQGSMGYRKRSKRMRP